MAANGENGVRPESRESNESLFGFASIDRKVPGRPLGFEQFTGVFEREERVRLNESKW
jgi:hypothetical protein